MTTILRKVMEKTFTRTSLAESSLLRYFTFTILYFAQGIPQGLLWYFFPAWFASNGKSPGEISIFVSVVALPWSLKIIAAPLTDRFSYLPMGRRKPWLLFGQFGLIVGVLMLALPSNPLDNLTTLMVVGFCLSMFGVFQDIAADALAIDLLPTREQGRANGLMWGARALSVAVTVAMADFFTERFAYTEMILCLAFIISLVTLVLLRIKERSCEKNLPWSPGRPARENLYFSTRRWRTVAQSLLQVSFLPASIIVALIAFCIAVGRGLIDALLPIFTVHELGWTDIHYSRLYSTTSVISGLVAMAVAGAMIDYWGKKRMISAFVFCLMTLTVCMALFSGYWVNASFVSGFFLLFYTLDTFVTIALFAIAMQLCWKRVSATQFALYMAVSNMGLSLGTGLTGKLTQFLSWESVFLFYTATMAVTIILIFLLNLRKHESQVDLLMSRFLDERLKSERYNRSILE